MTLSGRTRVFISYSHRDIKWLERLKVHLKPLIRDQEVEIWDATMIVPGSTWREDIEKAIATARAAILLVSADFLASDFIASNELTPLLQAAKTDGAIIVPVIISPSQFEENQSISQFQPVNPQRPLVNLKKGEQEAVLVRVVEAIKGALSISSESGAGWTESQIGPHQTSNSSSGKFFPQTGAVSNSSLPNSPQIDESESRHAKKYITIASALLIASILVMLGIYLSRKNPPVGELAIEADAAVVYLDLTSTWLELNEVQRKTEKLSKATLYGKFTLRKYDENATFSHRLGTSSEVPDPLNWRSDHEREAVPTKKRCAAEVKTTYMLNFDISKEKVNVPFDLNYEIDFWNAHNGDKSDWHQFYVSSPTKVLTFKISFPKNKPYTKLYFLSGEGGDCSRPPTPHKDPDFDEGVDEKTGAKTVTWRIENPPTHWVYRIVWEW